MAIVVDDDDDVEVDDDDDVDVDVDVGDDSRWTSEKLGGKKGVGENNEQNERG